LGILRSSHVGDSSDLAARIAYGRPYPSEDRGFHYEIGVPRQEVTHDLVKLSYHRDLDDGGNIDLQYGFQRNHRMEFDLRRAGRSAIPVLDMLLTTQTLDGVYEHITRTDRRRQVGVSGMLQVNNNVPGTFSTPLIPNFDSYAVGIFALERLVRNHFEVEAGIRYDYKHFSSAGFDRDGMWYGGDRDFHNISASAGAFWQATSSLGIRSNAGLAWRAPAANELYSNSVHNALARYERGNERLLSEKGIKWISSAELKSGRLNVSLDGYIHYVNGYIFSVPSGDIWQSIAGAFPIWEYRQTDALLSGVDLDASLLLGQWQYRIKASLIRARDISARTYPPLIPADRLEQQIRWQPETGGLLNNPYIQIMCCRPDNPGLILPWNWPPRPLPIN
jgi:iron complex outermembrane receptor protein